jgi:hypothetical protein
MDLLMPNRSAMTSNQLAGNSRNSLTDHTMPGSRISRLVDSMAETILSTVGCGS